jgi:hypothetical protein
MSSGVLFGTMAVLRMANGHRPSCQEVDSHLQDIYTIRDYTHKQKKYWYGVPLCPLWAFKSLKIPQISKMSLNMGNIRIYLVTTTKI